MARFRLLALIAALVALAAAAPTAPAAVDVAFKTPGTKVVCKVLRTAGGSRAIDFRCGIFAGRPSCAHGRLVGWQNDGGRLTHALDRKPNVWRCMKKAEARKLKAAAAGATVLTVGGSYETRGDIRCKSNATNLRCVEDDGHGFVLAAGGSRRF